ncbi:MAG: hypothetical protein HXL36_06075, partial [Prevotellaceae bacterium]|nr:hypothetical protein [Prevotellaceae bacterium]
LYRGCQLLLRAYGHRSTAVSSAYGGRHNHCSTVVSSAYDGRRITSVTA